MHDDTFFALYRKIVDSPVFKNADLLKMWIWILTKASYTEREQMVGLTLVSLQKGEFVFGRKTAAIALSMNESTVYKYLKWFEKEGMITSKSNNKFTVVSVVKWSFYQIDSKNNNSCVATKEQQNNNNVAAKEQQRNTNNKENNVNKDYKGKNIENDICADAQDHFPENDQGGVPKVKKPREKIQDPRFDEFWKIYPKKVEKKDAYSVWVKLKVTDELYNKIMGGLKNALRSNEWTKDNGQYVPAAHRWLKKARWDDEYTFAFTRPANAPNSPPSSLNGRSIDRDALAETLKKVGIDYKPKSLDDMRIVGEQPTHKALEG